MKPISIIALRRLLDTRRRIAERTWAARAVVIARQYREMRAQVA